MTDHLERTGGDPERVHGISERDVARIFGRFERAASPLHFPGIGLGLRIRTDW